MLQTVKKSKKITLSKSYNNIKIMKTVIKLAAAIVLVVITLTSCKKSNKTTPVGALGPNVPNVLNTIITPAILDTLESRGTIVNEGLTPPTVNGIYLDHPNYCTYDNSGANLEGSIFDDYEYEFTNQNSSQFTIQLNYKDVFGTDAGSDNSATYIIGTNDLFTIFAQASGVEGGISYINLQVLSGQFTSAGIANFQLSEYLVSKTGDVTNTILEPVHSTRIFNTENNVAVAQSSFSMVPKALSKNPGGNIFRANLSWRKR